MKDLRSMYLAGLADPIRALADALAARSGDPDGADSEIRRIAHQLKGSGASFGFPAVTDAASAVLEAKPRSIAAPSQHLLETLQRIVDRGDEGPTTVLVVEDDPAIQMLLQAALDGVVDDVVAAGTVADARAALSGSVPAAVLLDLVLPDGDGRAFLAEIRSRPELETVRVAVMSAHSASELRDECLALGADAYYEKPLPIDSIASRVSELLTAERPGDAGHRERPAPAEPAAASKVRLRVLIAEDDPLTAELLVDRLQRRGFEVLSCSDGQAALEAARHRNLAVAIIDVNMPRMNGFELLGRLRGMQRHAKTPVLVLTSVGDDASIVRAFDLGANDYVLKPFSPGELTARVSRLAGA